MDVQYVALRVIGRILFKMIHICNGWQRRFHQSSLWGGKTYANNISSFIFLGCVDQYDFILHLGLYSIRYALADICIANRVWALP